MGSGRHIVVARVILVCFHGNTPTVMPVIFLSRRIHHAERGARGKGQPEGPSQKPPCHTGW